MSGLTDAIVYCDECGHSIDRHAEDSEILCFNSQHMRCRLTPSDIVAARVAAGEQRITEALGLVDEIDDPRVQRPGMQRRRLWASRLRAALARPTDEAGP